MGQRMSTSSAGGFVDGALRGEAGGEGDPEGLRDGERRTDQRADVEAVAGARSATRGRRGRGRRSARRRCRRCLRERLGGGGEEQGVGGVDRGEVVQLGGEAGAGERAVDGWRDQSCCGALMRSS